MLKKTLGNKELIIMGEFEEKSDMLKQIKHVEMVIFRDWEAIMKTNDIRIY